MIPITKIIEENRLKFGISLSFIIFIITKGNTNADHTPMPPIILCFTAEKDNSLFM